MTDKTAFLDAMAPVLEIVATVDASDPKGAKAALDEKLPVGGEVLSGIKNLVDEGIKAGWLCNREQGGIFFSRPKKPEGDGDLSIDAVKMDKAGPGHTHPNGEIDLCFSVDGNPTFDGNPEGWTVYPPGSWHVPTVEGGTMHILYFLPDGAIQFGPKPE
jgi:hypothetical protein